MRTPSIRTMLRLEPRLRRFTKAAPLAPLLTCAPISEAAPGMVRRISSAVLVWRSWTSSWPRTVTGADATRLGLRIRVPVMTISRWVPGAAAAGALGCAAGAGAAAAGGSRLGVGWSSWRRRLGVILRKSRRRERCARDDRGREQRPLQLHRNHGLPLAKFVLESAGAPKPSRERKRSYQAIPSNIR